MVKNKIFGKGGIGILSMLLVMLAAVFGADGSFAMSMADAIEVNDDANAGIKPATEDNKGLETQLEGAATATHATETGFEEEEIDKEIANFLPFKFPLEYYIVNMARQVKVNSYHPTHYRSGSARIDVKYNGDSAIEAVNVSGTGICVTIPANDTENFKALKQCSTVHFTTMPGYDKAGENQVGCLSGYVLGNNGSEAKILLLNPSSTLASNNIPSRAEFRVGATAGSESQMIVPPINYQPVGKDVFLQKKIANIIMTDEWLKQAKKASHAENDLRNNALWQFKYQNAVTHYLGSEKKITVDVGGDIGEENVYFENGLLNQVTMSYSYDPKAGLEARDLHAIAALQFGKFSKNAEAIAFCSKSFIESLLNMEAVKVKNLDLGVKEVTQGFKVRSWVNNFGTIDFVYDPILAEIGYDGFAFVVDMKETTRYVKREEKTDTLDLKKTAEAREAKREMFSIIDCVALRGFNSVLIGPSDKLGKVYGLENVEDFIKTINAASDVATKEIGDVVYIGSDTAITDNSQSLEPGTLYKWDGTKWSEYAGALDSNTSLA